MTKDEIRDWLEKQLLAEHSKPQTMRLVRWVGHDSDRLQVLMEIFLDDPPSRPLPQGRGYQHLFTQRSAWAVRYVGEQSPEIMAPWLPKLAANLRKPLLHDAIVRNTLTVFEHLEFPSSLDDELADLCFGYLADPKKAIAIRCNAMHILEKICQRTPELQPELQLLIEEFMDHSSPGFKSRGKKVLTRIKKPSNGRRPEDG